jgi:integrase
MQGHESTHYPFLTTEELPAFFKALAGYSGSELMVLAARLLILTGLRTGELRGALWSEIDSEKALWEISAERMKIAVLISSAIYPSISHYRTDQSNDGAISYCFRGGTTQAKL